MALFPQGEKKNLGGIFFRPDQYLRKCLSDFRPTTLSRLDENEFHSSVINWLHAENTQGHETVSRKHRQTDRQIDHLCVFMLHAEQRALCACGLDEK